MDYSNHVAGFTKLFSGLVHSTVWREEMHVKVVWITMLALADRNGHVLASMPGLADASRVSLDQCEEALRKLSAPDKHSRTKEHEGRRIQEVDGGWALYNYTKYRNLRDDENRRQQVREAVSRHRAKVINVSHGKPIAEAEAEAGRKELPPLPPPPAERAEKATNDAINSLQLRLGALICQLSEHPNSRQMVPAWTREVTAYDRQDGTKVRGVADFRTVRSIDRLERSIGDAEWHLAELEKGVKHGA